MKLGKFLVLGWLITLSASANEYDSSSKAPASLVQSYLDYCSEIRPDDEVDVDSYLLNCVNTQLSDSEFDTFASNNDLVAYINRGDD